MGQKWKPERPQIGSMSDAELRAKVKEFLAYLQDREGALNGVSMDGFRQTGFGVAFCDWVLGARVEQTAVRARLPHPDD